MEEQFLTSQNGFAFSFKRIAMFSVNSLFGNCINCKFKAQVNAKPFFTPAKRNSLVMSNPSSLLAMFFVLLQELLFSVFEFFCLLSVSSFKRFVNFGGFCFVFRAF